MELFGVVVESTVCLGTTGHLGIGGTIFCRTSFGVCGVTVGGFTGIGGNGGITIRLGGMGLAGIGIGVHDLTGGSSFGVGDFDKCRGGRSLEGTMLECLGMGAGLGLGVGLGVGIGRDGMDMA